jgi:hypothetical protein
LAFWIGRAVMSSLLYRLLSHLVNGNYERIDDNLASKSAELFLGIAADGDGHGIELPPRGSMV